MRGLDTLQHLTSTAEFRLRHIAFVAGLTPAAESAHLEPGPVTVFVGPNNSGKSLALVEVHGWANQGVEPPQPWPGGRVISQIEAHWPPDDAALDQFLLSREFPARGGGSSRDRMLRSFSLDQPPMPGMGSSGGGVSVPRYQSGDFKEYCRTKILPAFTARLDGRSRFGLSEPRQLTSFRQAPGNHLAAILRDSELYRRVDREILDAFGYHVVIDMSQPPHLSLALSDEEPPPGDWLKRIDDQTIEYQERATPIAEFSDGVKIYTGLVSALESLPHVLLLIDEPEAFLHPTLARRLGGRLARTVRERDANLMVATHSAEFLMGCVAEVAETAIVRLGYERGIATARPLAGADVARLVGDPLLRSVDALAALFSRAAVVCEADSDRALYDEVNRRLLGADGRSGAPDTVFLNAQNWQTIPRIAGPLRRLGIPTAAVLDLDAMTAEDVWADYVSFATAEPEERADLHRLRKHAAEVLLGMGRLGTGTDGVLRCKVEGIEGVADPSDRVQLREAISRFAEYGIFIVPVGELERWLPSLGITNKKTWVTDALRRLGSRGDAVYVEPGPGDVWNFVESMAHWLNLPTRKGLS